MPKKKIKGIPELKIDDIVLKQRDLFLYSSVDDESILKLTKELLVLDSINHKPIKLWINSPGGSTMSGLSFINIMKRIKSKVITIINIQACSMASQISVAGDERWMVKNGWWMAHDMSGGIGGDYSAKVEYRAKWIAKHFKTLENNYKKYTNLTKKELEIARHGELWLTAEECLVKGIIDKLI